MPLKKTVNVKLIVSDDGAWSEGAYNLIAELTKGSLIYTQVAGYTPDDIPLVLCYIVTNNRVSWN